jgi:hypothetical protein
MHGPSGEPSLRDNKGECDHPADSRSGPQDSGGAMKRIFQVGFNKCGTRSLYHFFKDNGLASVHHQGGAIARAVAIRKSRGEDPLADYPDTVFFSDMISSKGTGLVEAYKDFRYIHSFYPDSYFILNTRDMESWIRSRNEHGELWKHYRRAFGILTKWGVQHYWRREWTEHHAEVCRYFAQTDGQLLVFDIERDDPRLIAEFLAKDFAIDPSHYQHVGKTVPGRALKRQKRERRTAKAKKELA